MTAPLRAPRLSDDLLESMLYHRERTDDTNAYRVAAEVQDVRALRGRIEDMRDNLQGVMLVTKPSTLRDMYQRWHDALRDILAVLGGGDGER